MKRRHFTLAITSSLATGLCLQAHAQQDEDRGEYVILQARYGTDQAHADVTDALRRLARRDQRVRVTNDLFGVDPDPGRSKILRIFVRDRQGQERSFDFRERDFIDGSQFIGWAGGRWGEPAWQGGWQGSASNGNNGNGNGNGYGNGNSASDDGQDDGEFTILSATYGTARREVDVTPQLRELARRDQRFRMGNDTFGVDPDPGHSKLLRILARDRRGQERSFEYREGSTVDGAQFVGWRRGARDGSASRDNNGPVRPGRLVIESASYGVEGRWVDVTAALRGQVRGDRFEAEVSNELLGYDPAPGQRKLLSVTYRVGKAPSNTVRVSERDMMRLP